MTKKRGDAARILITLDGETRSITEWAKKQGLSKQVISKRLKAGWPPRKAILKKTAEEIEG